MVLDPRKRQKKLERKTAKRKTQLKAFARQNRIVADDALGSMLIVHADARAEGKALALVDADGGAVDHGCLGSENFRLRRS